MLSKVFALTFSLRAVNSLVSRRTSLGVKHTFLRSLGFEKLRRKNII